MKILNLLVAVSFLSLVACKKDKETEPKNDCRINKIMRETDEVDAEYTYNANDQVIKVHYPTASGIEISGSALNLTYDANGKITNGKYTYNDPKIGNVQYTFNSNGLLTQVKGEDPDSYSLANYEYNADMQLSKIESYSKLSAGSPLKHMSSNTFEYRNGNVEKVNSAIYSRGMSQADTVYITTVYEYANSKNPFYEFRFFNPSELNFSVNNPVKATTTYTDAAGTVTDTNAIQFTYQFNDQQLPTQVTRTYVNGSSAPFTTKFDYTCN